MLSHLIAATTPPVAPGGSGWNLNPLGNPNQPQNGGGSFGGLGGQQAADFSNTNLNWNALGTSIVGVLLFCIIIGIALWVAKNVFNEEKAQDKKRAFSFVTTQGVLILFLIVVISGVLFVLLAGGATWFMQVVT